MNELLQIRLFQLASHNGNILDIYNCLDYSQQMIHHELTEMVRNSYFELSDQTIGITDKGKKEFAMLCRKHNMKGISRFLIPRYDQHILRTEIEEIYVPLTIHRK